MTADSLLCAPERLQNPIEFGSLFFAATDEGRTESIAETFSFGAGFSVSTLESENIGGALELVALGLRPCSLNCIYTALRTALILLDRNGLKYVLLSLPVLQCLWTAGWNDTDH